MKYEIKELDIEVTRKCNYACVHCVKGNAQNNTITTEIIDTMFSQCSQIDTIKILGGETLLEIDVFKTLLEKIDEYGFSVSTLSFVTNGSILNISIINALFDFVNRGFDRKVSFIISDDKYHDCVQSEKAFTFYTANNPDKQHIIVEKMERVRYEKGFYSANEKLTYGGRAVDLYKDNPEIPVYYPECSIRSHQICIQEGNIIECSIQLCANGNIVLGTSISYETEDKLAIGNIQTESLEQILRNHNDTCPYLCDECYCETLCKNMSDFAPYPPMEKEIRRLKYSFYQKRTEYMWFLRKRIKECLPHISMQTIIQVTQVQGYKEWLNSMQSIKRVAPRLNYKIKPFAEYKKQYMALYPNASQNDIQQLCYWGELMDITEIYFNIIAQTDILQIPVFSKLAISKEKPPELDVCQEIANTLSEIEGV